MFLSSLVLGDVPEVLTITCLLTFYRISVLHNTSCLLYSFKVLLLQNLILALLLIRAIRLWLHYRTTFSHVFEVVL
jgi:hypothetical protein